MEIKDLTKKETRLIYVIYEDNIFNGTKRYYTDKEEALKEAEKKKECVKNNIVVNMLEWDNKEERYGNMYIMDKPIERIFTV